MESSNDDVQSERVHLVDQENMDLPLGTLSDSNETSDGKEAPWYQGSYILVMHEPPHLYYEPKEWSSTSVLLVKHENLKLSLPGGPVWQGESYQECAVRRLLQDHGIDVCLPENCLHHLFTFPFEHENTTFQTKGVWGDFYECVFRGSLDKIPEDLQLCSLVDLKHWVDDDKLCEEHFDMVTGHALKLYFQRQGDLHIKRRLMKGYSSVDLEHYGLDNTSSDKQDKIVFLDTNSFQRQKAVEFTMKTDDGLSPKSLPEADVVLLGVSRVGKSPLSLYIAQTSGLKVANIPLVQELNPPQQLFSQVDPKRVFCLTMNAQQLHRLRMTRFRREMKKQLPGQRTCIYADADYVQKDLEYAQRLARDHGFTEFNISNRAMEENSSLIVLKMKERFPNMHII